MIDVRADSIIYQAQVYFSNLVDDLVKWKPLGKSLDSKWEKADTILGYLDAYTQLPKLQDDDDITNTNYILECLINICELNNYPFAVPLSFSPAPAIIVGKKGDKGDKGDTGEKGDTGLATDFQVAFGPVPTVVDSFPITDAHAARWDYMVTNTTSGAVRAGTIIGHWNADGSLYDLFDNSDSDTGGDTGGLEFDLTFFASSVQLTATVNNNNWSVVGSRYYIPNNGNGSGPVGDILPIGQIYIGNNSNMAQNRTMTGDVTINVTGVTAIGLGVINNSHIDASANISLSKLALLTPNRIVVSNGLGVMSSPSGSLNAGGFKITNVTPGAAPGEVVTFEQLVVGGPPTGPAGGNLSGTYPNPSVVWSDGYPTYDARYLRSGGVDLRTSSVNIGDWNMDSTFLKTVNFASLGITSVTKIRAIQVLISSDAGQWYTLNGGDDTYPAPTGWVGNYTNTTINLYRLLGSKFDVPGFSSVPFNRGIVTITYET